MSRGEKRGPSALEAWARQKTDGYDGVAIRNMTTSWRNGLAFCALIHRYRPDLIEFEKLDPCDILGNCSLAFEVAERQLGIPALLDPEDMAAHEVPDRLSVLTYVAQFYNTFKSIEKKSTVTSRLSLTPDANVVKTRPGDKSISSSPEKVVLKRTLDMEDEIMNEARKRVPPKSVMLSSSTVCSECKNPVYISERILFSKKLYHRSCFRCFNCNRILNPHTADVSPEGLLFCLENACHVELRRRSRESCINVSSNNESNTSVSIGVAKGKESPKYESVVNSTKSTVNVSPNQNEIDNKSVIPENRKTSLQANFPPFNEKLVLEDNPVETNSLVKNRVAALRMKFLDECQGDLNMSTSRPSPLRDDESRVRDRSGSRSPLQISVGNEPSDVLVVTMDSKFENSLKVIVPQVDKLDGKDEGISSLEDKCGDSSSKLDVRLAPEITNIHKQTPVFFTIAEQLTKNTQVVNNCEETYLGKEQHNDNSQPLRLCFKEDCLSVPIPEPNTEIKPEPEVDLQPDRIVIDSPAKESDIPEIEKNKFELPEAVPETESNVSELESNVSELESNVPELESNVPELEFNVPNLESNMPDLESNVPEAELKPDDVMNVSEFSDVPCPVPLPVPEKINNTVPESSEIKALPEILEPVSHLPKSPTSFKELESITAPGVTPSPSPRKKGAPPRPVQMVTSKPSDIKQVWKKQNYYPAELNPFESEEQLALQPSKNPFEDEEAESTPKPSPKIRSNRSNVNSIHDNSRLRSRSRSPSAQSCPPPSPKPRNKVVSNLRISSTVEPKSSNPFEDDDEEEDESGVSLKAGDETSSTCSHLSDGSSFNSSISGSVLPIPRPKDRDKDSIFANVQESNSMKLKSRKTKRAPLPPAFIQSSEPIFTVNENSSQIPKSPKSILKNSHTTLNGTSNLDQSNDADISTTDRSGTSSPGPKKIIQASPKLLKGLKNHTNQTAAQQYKKKRRAPPPRRRVEPLPEASIKTELVDLCVQEHELERQGITLESTIRRLMDQETNDEQLDEMMVQLWNIINEKNEILQRQTELEFLMRGHRLEEMQAELEFQLRVLMDTPLSQRQEDHTHVENTLLEEMLKLVDERNEVVDWLDFHRKQDREEATRVSESLTSFTIHRKSDPIETSQNAIVLTTLPRTKSSKKSKTKDKGKDKDKDKQSKEKKNVNNDKDKNKDDKNKIKFGTLFGRKKNKGKKDKLDEDKDLDESLSTSSR